MGELQEKRHSYTKKALKLLSHQHMGQKDLKRTDIDTKFIRKRTLVVHTLISSGRILQRQNICQKQVDKGSVLKTIVRVNAQVQNQ